MSSLHPHQAQLVALATLQGLTLALLRKRGALTEYEVQALFTLTDSLLPEDPSGMAAMALTTARNVAALEVGEDSVED